MTGIQFRTPIESPNGGSVDERRSLHKRFEERLSVAPNLTRRIVSHQGNRDAPGFRWLKYKEGFSLELVERLLAEAQPSSVLDPFAGRRASCRRGNPNRPLQIAAIEGRHIMEALGLES